MGTNKPKIALWFRYGPADHAVLFHAMPLVVERLAQHCEVHYFGLRSRRPVPEVMRNNAILHYLPFTVDRANKRDKHVKAFLWWLMLPVMALHCRLLGIHVIYIDDSTPLSGFTARLLSGAGVAYSVVDFLTDIYFAGIPVLSSIGRLIRTIDLATAKRLPLLFTRTKSAARFLVERGTPSENVHPVYDPCDLTLYHPIDKARARDRYAFKDSDVVLVHHGIMHPNKGNDIIIRAIAPLAKDYPQLKYLLVGDGPDMPRLKRITAELGLEEMVLFTGWLPGVKEVNEALNAGDIGLVMRVGHESDHFHLTGALVHSMACALPILAANLGGVAEVIKEEDGGLLFEPNDPDMFRTKLIRLMEDASLRRRCGQRTLELARELFDMDRTADATVRPLVALAQARYDRKR